MVCTSSGTSQACARLVDQRARPDRGLLTDEHADLWSMVP